jgi:gliding motility associated protien GldN
MRKFFIIICLSIASNVLLAQQNTIQSKIVDNPPKDGYAIKSDIQDRRVIPYSNVRSGDVVFSKRIWREMDLNDSRNHVFASPKARLIDVIMDAVSAGELTAYDPTPTKEDPTGDSFLKRLDPGQALGRFVDSVLVPQFDDEGYEIGSSMMPGEFNSESVTRFRIKEDWFYDKQRSVFEPRIIGIAPLMKINMGGVSLDEQPAFWIYFPEARHIFVNKEVADPVNDAIGISFDDLFTRRLFSSTIVKESNPQDLRLKDMGVDEAQEASKIEEKLDGFNKSIWVEVPEEPEKIKRGIFGRKEKVSTDLKSQ